MIILNLFLISFCWVIILDLSGFMTSIKRVLARFLNIAPSLSQNISLKPFDCSFCMTWWSSLIYLLITSSCSLLNISLALLFAFLTGTTKDFLYLIQDLFTYLFGLISKLLRL